MTRWMLLCLWAIATAASASACPTLVVVLDPRITGDVLEQAWRSGEARDEAPAVLELRGCAGEVQDRMVLEAPLARIEHDPLRGVSPATWLVSVDLTAPVGSYSGPFTRPFFASNGRLRVASARTDDGRLEPVRLAATGKAAWKKWPAGARDDLLSVQCEPRDGAFVVTYRRYRTIGTTWQVRSRTETGFWESDDDFPQRRSFP